MKIYKAICNDGSDEFFQKIEEIGLGDAIIAEDKVLILGDVHVPVGSYLLFDDDLLVVSSTPDGLLV